MVEMITVEIDSMITNHVDPGVVRVYTDSTCSLFKTHDARRVLGRPQFTITCSENVFISAYVRDERCSLMKLFK